MIDEAVDSTTMNPALRYRGAGFSDTPWWAYPRWACPAWVCPCGYASGGPWVGTLFPGWKCAIRVSLAPTTPPHSVCTCRFADPGWIQGRVQGRFNEWVKGRIQRWVQGSLCSHTLQTSRNLTPLVLHISVQIKSLTQSSIHPEGTCRPQQRHRAR